jgi:hypothetical protein
MTMHISLKNEIDKMKAQYMYDFIDNQCVLGINDVDDLAAETLISDDEYKKLYSIENLEGIIVTLD